MIFLVLLVEFVQFNALAFNPSLGAWNDVRALSSTYFSFSFFVFTTSSEEQYETQLWLYCSLALGWVAFSCAAYSFGAMEVGDATAIFFTSPAWAALLGRAVLRERLGLFDGAAIALALVGVTLVARPAFVFAAAPPNRAASRRQPRSAAQPFTPAFSS